MELREAYKKWGFSQEGKSPYHTTKLVFSKAWAKLYQGKPCEFYTMEKLSEALAKPSLSREERAKSASVMVQVLQFAHKMEPKVNPEPNFTYEELVHASTPPRVEMQENQKIDLKELNSVPYPSEDKHKRGLKDPRKVCQVDIIEGKLRLIKEFSSVNEAQKALHITNICRAADGKSRSGAWYWCYAEDFSKLTAKDFKRSKIRKARVKSDVLQVTEALETKDSQEKTNISSSVEKQSEVENQQIQGSLKDFSDEELIAELKSRGWRGPICKIITVDL